MYIYMFNISEKGTCDHSKWQYIHAVHLINSEPIGYTTIFHNITVNKVWSIMRLFQFVNFLFHFRFKIAA